MFLSCCSPSWQFSVDRHDHLWTVKLLRHLVVFVTTLGFIPICQTLLTPTQCDTLRDVSNDPTLSCGQTFPFVIVTTVSLAAFVPFCLATSLVYYSIDCGTGVGAASTGRHQFLHTGLRVVLVGLTTQAAAQGSATNLRIGCLTFALTFFMLLFMCVRLPFYHQCMNQLWAAYYGMWPWPLVRTCVP